MPDRIATARQSGEESSLREKAVEAFFSSNRSAGFQEAIDAVIAVCMEEAARLIERDEYDTSVRLDPRIDRNLSDWIRRQQASAIRSLIPTSEAE